MEKGESNAMAKDAMDEGESQSQHLRPARRGGKSPLVRERKKTSLVSKAAWVNFGLLATAGHTLKARLIQCPYFSQTELNSIKLGYPGKN